MYVDTSIIHDEIMSYDMIVMLWEIMNIDMIVMHLTVKFSEWFEQIKQVESPFFE